MSEKGYLFIADISGYTEFLSSSELDHAGEILTSLINTMLETVEEPLILARVEGDAIFAYTISMGSPKEEALMDAIQNIYFAFHHALESSDRNTTCDCHACTNMKGLNLKIVIHYGEFYLQTLGKQTELAGKEVNLTHRLLKNSIIEKTGIEGYLFLTQAALEAQGYTKSPNPEIIIPHKEEYEHLGVIEGWVFNLLPLWEKERENRRIIIKKEDSIVHVHFELPVPPSVAWDYLNEPESRARYRNSDSSKVTYKHSGRLEVGAIYHCVHGENINFETVIDWKPYEYVTFSSRSKGFGIDMSNKFTVSLTENENGTHVDMYYGKIKGNNKIAQKVIDSTLAKKMSQVLTLEGKEIPIEINKMIEEDRKSGSLSMKLIGAGKSVDK